MIAWILPALLVAGIYARTARYGLVWDDEVYLVHDSYVSCDLSRILLSPANDLEYLPVRDLSVCADYWLFGLDYGGFHVTNVVIFAAATVLVQRLYRLLFRAANEPGVRDHAQGLGLLCACIFAVHPLQVEPVAFLTGRNALLALFFLVATLLCYARAVQTGDRRFYWASVALTPLALFSKATAVALPLLLVPLHLFLVRSTSPLTALKHCAPHVVITAACVLLHVGVTLQSGMLPAQADPSITRRLLHVSLSPQFYLYKFFWPLELSIEYTLAFVFDHLVWLVVGAYLFAGACILLLRRGWRARPLEWMLCAGYLAAMVPVSNIMLSIPPVADRYAQIPILFLAPVPALLARWPLPRIAAITAATACVTLLAAQSVRQVGYWESNRTLFTHAVDVDPGAIVSLENLGMALWRQGKLDEAEEALRQLSEIAPQTMRYSYFLGSRAMERGEHAEAERLFRLALEKEGNLAAVHGALGLLYARTDRIDESVESYERALELGRSTLGVKSRASLQAQLDRVRAQRRSR